MDSNSLTIFGILLGTTLTIGGTLLTYYKTVGARKEREEQARKEAATVLRGLLSQDQTSIDVDVVEAVLKSKSREHNVDELTIADLAAMVEDALCAFAEDPLLAADKKKALISKTQAFKQKIEVPKRLVSEGGKIIKDSSRSPYRWGIVATFAAGVFLALWMTTTYGYYAAVNTSGWTSPTIVTGSVALATVVMLSAFVVTQTQLDVQKKKATTLSYVEKAFEETVVGTLRRHFGESRVGSFEMEIDGHVTRFDVMFESGGERIPVEIKYGSPNAEMVFHMSLSMKEAKLKKGLLITSSQLHKPVKALARTNGIVVFEAVISENDLAARLKTLTKS
jgi:hypothetical protein